jgi:hypothetical protein
MNPHLSWTAWPAVLVISCVALLTSPLAARAQFWFDQPANPVVVRVGDGISTVNSNAAVVTLQQYVAGVPTQASPASSVTFASADANRLVVSGSATSEGNLTNSVDRGFVTLGGYDANAGTAAVVGSSAPRVVGYASVSSGALPGGTLNPSLSSTTAYPAGNIRSAVSLGGAGSNTWTGGTASSANGVRLNLETSWSTTVTNVRTVDVLSNNVFFSTGSGTQGIHLAGGTSDTPPVTAQVYISTVGTGGGTPSPYEFVLFNNPNGNQTNLPTGNFNTAYIADDRSVANGGGIQKWQWDGTTWALQYTLAPTGVTVGLRGLAGYWDGTNAVLFTTEAATTNNVLYQVADTGAGASFTTLASSGANFVFRGVALAPVPEPATVLLVGAAGLGAAGFVRRRFRRAAPAPA